MYCPQCSAEISKDARFCNNCGKMLVELTYTEQQQIFKNEEIEDDVGEKRGCFSCFGCFSGCIVVPIGIILFMFFAIPAMAFFISYIELIIVITIIVSAVYLVWAKYTNRQMTAATAVKHIAIISAILIILSAVIIEKRQSTPLPQPPVVVSPITTPLTRAGLFLCAK